MFSGCSSGVACFTSYHQCAQSEIFEVQNSKDIYKGIVFNLNIYYRQENCTLLGHCTASSASFLSTFCDRESLSFSRVFLNLRVSSLPTFRDKLSVTFSSIFWPLAIIYYRRFRTNYRSQLQISFWLLISSWRGTERFSPKHLLEISSTPCVITQKSAVLIYFLAEACNNASVTGSSSRQTHNTDQRAFIFLNPVQNLYSIVLGNAWLRKEIITIVSGENVSRSIEMDFNRLMWIINPLNPELNPICYFLALLGAHHFLPVSRIRVKLLTFRLLMSYIYGAPILDVSRSHTTTQHSR